LVRERVVEAREMAGFGNLAKTVSAKWKALEQTDPALFQKCQEMKREDAIRYERELAKWLALKQATTTKEEKAEKAVSRNDSESEEMLKSCNDPMVVLHGRCKLLHSEKAVCSWNLWDNLGFDLANNTLSQPDLAKVDDSDSDNEVSFDYDEPMPSTV
jgi:hypothetical protein